MFFKNLSFFRYPASTNAALEQLEERLAEHPLKPVGPLELSSRGFVSPFGRDEPALVHRVGDCAWLTLGREDRLLPGAVVNEALAKKLAEIEAKEGRRLGGKARRQLKEDLVHEMLPKAFVKGSRLSASIDARHGMIAIDAASKKSAEAFVSELRHALGSFPAVPVNAEVSVRALMTGWLTGEPLPEGLALGDECELKDPVDGGAVVKAQRQELTAEEMVKHLEGGKQVTRLALVLDEQVSFVLGEDLVLRKFRLLDGAVETLENTERDSLAAELDARYALFSAEVHRVFGVLEKALKLSRVD
ncbi:MAG: recombination-associated protein RdgC [Silanimonas sp.]|nr:MAG: recombination-associated protein RdgC [Silanimonas sp.]